MADELSCRQYMSGEVVTPKQLMEHLVVCAHNNYPYIPDHFYKAWNRKAFCEAMCCETPMLQDYFIKLLPHFCETYFEIAENSNICVKDSKWNEWQIVAREFSPSVMKVLFIWKKCKEDPALHVSELIGKNCLYTCLPYSGNALIKQKRNLMCDDHVHAGSSLEADIAWLHLMYDPKFFISDKKRWNEELKIHGIIKSRMDIYKLVLIGKRLIDEIHARIKGDKLLDTNGKENDLLWHINKHTTESGYTIIDWFHNGNPLQEEAQLVHDALKNINKRHLAILLHYYLLIKGCVRCLLSVQSSQYGLEQFNQTLHAPFRGGAMDYLSESLKQMAGNDLKGVKSIELRISPSHLKQMDTIKKAVMELHDAQPEAKTEVRLVCHFIKGIDWEKQYSFIDLSIHELSGIDVAGSDFKASPGVFVDAFDRLCNNSYGKHLHYTYHAGEDFFHLLDGLRIIYEAVEFLRLNDGDRIGHASAAGVDPMLWAHNLNECLPIKQGMYLDNLLFASILYRNRITNFQLPLRTKRKLVKTIQELANTLGCTFKAIKELENWYKKRKTNCDDFERQKCYKRIIEVDCFDVFSPEELTLFQKEILKRLKDKDIAIETTPTSNVTIGHHHTFRTYHLLTWLKWKQQGLDVPDIVLGTDETGVFPTNIANEYANILELLQSDNEIKAPEQEVDDIILMSETKAFHKF